MFKKLRIKLTAYMGVILVLFMLFIATGIYNFTKYIFEDGNKKLMQSEAIKIYSYNDTPLPMHIIPTNKGFGSLSPKLAIFGSDKIKVSYAFYDKSFKLAYYKQDEKNTVDSIIDLAVDAYCTKTDSYIERTVNGTNYRIYTKYVNDPNQPGVVQLYQDTANEEIIWSFLKTVLFLFGTMGVIILLALSYYFTGKALKPVNEAWIKQKEFVADASHELRTPLTVIQTNLDVIMSDDEDCAISEHTMWLDNVYSETRVMARLIDQLLTLAKADANEGRLDIMEISLSEIVDDVCENMKMLAKNKKIDFEFNIEDDIIIKADYDKIRRLSVILIDNAVKYTEIGKVTVRLYSEKNRKILVVEDTGIGISDKDIKRIFDRFYRADKARHRQGGTGLGLSIAKWIIDAHRATVEVQSVLDEGTRFIVKF